MVANAVGRVAVRYLPQQFAAIEMDRREHAVGRLHHRQALHRQPAGWFDVPATFAVAGWQAGVPDSRASAACAIARGESAAQQSPGPNTSTNGWPLTPRTYRISENPCGRRDERVRVEPGIRCRRICDVCFGIVAAAGPVGAAAELPMLSDRAGRHSTENRRVEQRARLVSRELRSACARSSGVKSMMSSGMLTKLRA